MDWLAFSSGKTNSYNLLSLTVPMEAYSTFLHIIVIVSFRCKLFSCFKVFAQVSPKSRKQRNSTPKDHSSFSLLVIRLLRLLAKAKIMTSMFGDHPPIHESLLIPIKISKFLQQCLLIIQDVTQQALNTSLHNQQAGIFCLFFSKIVQVHKDAFVSLLLKELLCLGYLLP